MIEKGKRKRRETTKTKGRNSHREGTAAAAAARQIPISKEQADLAENAENESENPSSSSLSSSSPEISLRPGTLLLLDDFFVAKPRVVSSSSNGNDLNSTAPIDAAKHFRESFLSSLTFAQGLALEKSHHLGIHFVLTTQDNFTGSGHNLVSSAIKTIRNNVDSQILFASSLPEARNFLQKLATGQDYKRLRDLYIESVENTPDDSPADDRITLKYLILNMTANTEKHLRFRQFTFNTKNKEFSPFSPAAFLNFKEDDHDIAPIL